jgi:hypothetical protein
MHRLQQLIMHNVWLVQLTADLLETELLLLRQLLCCMVLTLVWEAAVRHGLRCAQPATSQRQETQHLMLGAVGWCCWRIPHVLC